MMRSKSRGGLVALVSLALACSDAAMPPDSVTPLLPTPFVVSNPVPGIAPAPGVAPATRSASSGSSVSYVSLPPGAIPHGVTANIRDLRTGSSVTAAVVDGGFDPVPLPAVAGDTLAIVVQTIGGAGPSSFLTLVSITMRPTVIRTSPPSHKRDVPLNAILVIVFSEPMDSATLLGSVTLSLAGSPVPGKVVIPPNSGDILEATFVPDAPLTPLTTYQLQISAAARDRDGDALAVPMQSDFTTSVLGPDLSAPLITILGPASGGTVAPDYPSLWINVEDDRGLTDINCQLLLEQPGGPPQQIWPRTLDCNHENPSVQPLDLQLGPGTYTFLMAATDAAGNTGYSAPITLTFVDPDPQPRIVVRSFSVIEYEHLPAGSGRWSYAPQLVVADAPGQGGLEIVGFQMLTIPGLTLPYYWRLWWSLWARFVAVGPGQDIPLFRGDIYGDYDWSFGDGHLSSGGQVSARLTYRDATTHHLYATTIQGSIVPGPPVPGTYTGGCSYWDGPYASRDHCGP